MFFNFVPPLLVRLCPSNPYVAPQAPSRPAVAAVPQPADQLISRRKSFTLRELQNDKRALRAESSTLWPSVPTLVCYRSSSHSVPKVHSAPSARGLLTGSALFVSHSFI